MEKGYKAFRGILRDINRMAGQADNTSIPSTMKTDNKDSLKTFYEFLSRYKTINGEMENGEVKRRFASLGKKAFEYLAEFIRLKEYKVDFNRGGPAVSGDLILRGMYFPGRGIYLSLNREGVINDILYRSITAMNDYSGGRNQYLPLDDLLQPGIIRDRIYRLCKLNESEITDTPIASQAMESTEGIEKVKQGTSGKEEHSRHDIEEEIDLNDKKNPVTEKGIKQLYELIAKGVTQKLPDLLEAMKDKENQQELKRWRLTVYKLIHTPGFIEHLDSNLWDSIPQAYKQLKAIQPAVWNADPKDKELRRILENFISRNNLRPSLMGANFDSKGIIASDMIALIFINRVSAKSKGVYCITKFCFQKLHLEEDGQGMIDEKFPNYANVIPKEMKITLSVPADTLRLFCQGLIRAGLVNNERPQAILMFAQDEVVGLDLFRLQTAAETMIKLGYRQLSLGYSGFSRAMIMCPEGSMKKITSLETAFILLMPIAPDEVENDKYLLKKGDLLLDLTTQQIITYGVEQKNTPLQQLPEKVENIMQSIPAETREKEKEQAETQHKGANANPFKADHWFNDHPEKVLGTSYQTTDRFNKPVTRIKGSMQDIIQGIDVPQVHALAPGIPILKGTSSTTTLLKDPEKQKNIEKVISQSKEALKERQLRKIMGENEKTQQAYEPGMHSFSEVMKQYNKGISKAEIQAWIWYKRISGGFNDEKVILNKANGWLEYVVPLGEASSYMKNWMEEGVICFNGGSFLPSVVYYAGNIYQRLEQLSRDKTKIEKEFGTSQYERQLKGLEQIKPVPLNLTEREVNNRLFIKPTGSFAKETFISELADGTQFVSHIAGQEKPEQNALSLQAAFKRWLNSLPKIDFKKSTDRDIISYYLEGNSGPAYFSKEEKLRMKQNAKAEGDRLFIRFLAEALTPDDQQRVEGLWNAKYNGYVEVNYQKIPVAFTCSDTFKNRPLFIRPVQREGLGFINVHGSGCIAFDVGLGKTMTAILALAQALEMGQCKRPFIVVPNQTYKNWIAELKGKEEDGKVVLSGLLPQYTVNDLYNLGEDYLHTFRDEKGRIKKVPLRSISVMTYEGFNRLSFSKETWDRIGDELALILNQDSKNKRDIERLKGRIEEMMGKGMKGGMVDIEDLGFDYMVVDEAHAMKKSFNQVKGNVQSKTLPTGEDDENAQARREKSPYAIHSGQPSMTALRGFMLSQYILRNNNMRNVLLLTATPFTNSPLEIYSMLALIGYQQLEKLGIKNIREFFDTFIKTSIDLVINAQLRPVRKEVVLGFHNLIPLQQLIFHFIIYRTGEEAEIQRPNKIVLPLVNRKVGDQFIPLPPEEQVSTNLPMTRQQKAFMQDVELYVRGKQKLSHFCANPYGQEDIAEEEMQAEEGGEELNEENFSEEERDGARVLRGLSFARQLALSPYLYGCNPDKNPSYDEYIESSPKLQYVMGCIRSVKLYHQQHHEEVSGQVIYMNAGVHFFPLIKEYLVRKVGFEEDEVGIIMGGMNAAKKEGVKQRFLSGIIKVLIGSDAIKEGVNLQDRATVLYNCWLNWNPTDIKQLEGRIWRYGNMYANVRIVNALMEDSIDIFTFQKLQEKTSRINEIWYRDGKTNTLNLEEFNPTDLKMGLITDPEALAELMLGEERERLQDEITGLDNQKKLLSDIADQRDIFNKGILKIKNTVNAYRPEKGKARSMDAVFRVYRDYLDDEQTPYSYQENILYDQLYKAYLTMRKGIEYVLQPRGMDINFDVKLVTGQLEKEINEIKKTLTNNTGEDALRRTTQLIINQRIKENYQPRSVKQQIDAFASMNDPLLSEKMIYEGDPLLQEKAQRYEQEGADLEEVGDTIAEMQQLLADMEEMGQLLKEIEALRNVA